MIVAGVTAVAGVGSALVGSHAASNAADASERATEATNALQREALAVAQSNTATARGVGDAALRALATKYGLTLPQAQAVVANPNSAGDVLGQAGGQSAPQGQAGQPNWDAYIAADPGITTEFNRVNAAGRNLTNQGIDTVQQYAAQHWANTGQGEEGRLNPYTGIRNGQTEIDPQFASSFAPAQQAQTPAATATAPTTPAAPTGPVLTAAGQPGTPAPTASSIDANGYYTAPRPTPAVAPTYTAPTLTKLEHYTPTKMTTAPNYVAPTYRETAIAPLDVSVGNYQQSPDYNFQLEEGDRNILAKASQAGGLESGATLKALQAYGQNLALGDYGEWRDYATGQYNQDRGFTANRDDAFNSNAVNNAQFGANLANNQWQSTNAFNQNENQFGANLSNNQNQYENTFNQSNALANFQSAQGNYQYGTGLAQNTYNSDRDYATGRADQNTNALFNLANLGQGAAANYMGAAQSAASNQGNALTANASNQGNAALASAGQTNSFLSNGVNALAYYYGNAGGSTPASGTRNPGTYAPENYGYV